MTDQLNNSTAPDVKQTQKQKNSTTQRRRRRKQKIDKAIVIASIGAMTTIIVGFFSFQPLVNWLNSKLTPTPFPTVAQTLTPILVVTDTPTIPPTFTFTPTLENIDTSTLTPEAKTIIMTVILQANASEGKSPLLVNFNAKASFVKFADGSTAACGETHFCKFTWAVYRDSQLIDNSTGGEGVFSYTFTRKGLYFITTFVCRGEACGDDGVTIEVR